MRVDGKSLRLEETRAVNEVIDRLWNDWDTETVDKEGMIQAIWGPDEIELMVAGDLWIVNDRDEPNAVIYHDASETWVASRELFKLCSRYSPRRRLTWHLEAQNV